ncbi:MAG: hypothetical protein ACLTPR_11745 [Enterococcus canintestini]|uniref:hypothetical protein n=1 Tax=Enterococcus canintestini TaxID=317010 RepID=UPI0039933E2B
MKTVFKMELYHINTTITLMKNGENNFSIEIENDVSKEHEYYEKLSYLDAEKLINDKVSKFAKTLKVR